MEHHRIECKLEQPQNSDKNLGKRITGKGKRVLSDLHHGMDMISH